MDDWRSLDALKAYALTDIALKCLCQRKPAFSLAKEQEEFTAKKHRKDPKDADKKEGSEPRKPEHKLPQYLCLTEPEDSKANKLDEDPAIGEQEEVLIGREQVDVSDSSPGRLF